MKAPSRITTVIGLLLTLHVGFSECTGKFYVGLLGYNNSEGVRCCGNQDQNKVTDCMEKCWLIFEIRVDGLNGTQQSKNLSDKELPLADAISIPSSMVNNPLSFNFIGWHGDVNVTVLVTARYNNTVIQHFDLFQYTYEGHKPTYFYYSRKVDSELFPESAQLTMVFRYRCDPVKGPTCFGDCVDHDDGDTCPPTLPDPTSDIYTGFTDPACGELHDTGNCSLKSTTPSGAQTTPSEETLESTDSVDSYNETVTPTTRKIYQDSNTNMSRDSMTTSSPKEETTFEPDVAETSETTFKDEINPTTVSEISGTISTKDDNSEMSQTQAKQSTPTVSTVNTTSKLSSKRSTVTSKVTDNTGRISIIDPSSTSTTPSEISTKIDDDPLYWPAIVGGVLGGIAVLSALGFCIYYRRQKKLRKRQEIYNVNPKVLRNFEEYEENGTSGRADVPLETEQY